ncbi:MAG: hypothetical protein ACYDA8_06425 [Deferrisomatales bacterium]
MDPLDTLTEVEALYGRVHDLAREQEDRLRAGDLGGLPALLAAKAAAVDQAQGLLADLRGRAFDRSAPTLQAALGRLAATVARVVEAEDRCRALVPAQPPAAPRARVAAAYGAGRR